MVRRPLSEQELRHLIEATKKLPVWRGMPGIERSWFYALAAMTGLRRSELASLRPESFRLDVRPPIVIVEAAYTKNARLAEQPLPENLLGPLREWLGGKTTGQPVFELPAKTGLMLKIDLRRCGIEPEDAQGRVVDVHSLRHTYIVRVR